MSERVRIAFLTGCAFVIGLHLRTAGHLIADGWRGPYAAPAATALADGTDAGGRDDEVALRAERAEGAGAVAGL
jgi:hypothetical protein